MVRTALIPAPRSPAPRPVRAGFVYLLALLVVLVVAMVAVTMSRGVVLRLRAGQDATARAQCRAAALGVLRAVVNDLDTALTAGQVPQLITVTPGGETVGDCTVLLIGRDSINATTGFGLMAEGGKVNVNQASTTTLAALPGMSTAIAAAISDWRDTDDVPDQDGGAERSDSAYQGAAVPYAPRNAPLELIEELRLVRDVTDTLYFGEDANGNGRLDAGEDADGDGALTLGLRDLLTVETREPANAPDGLPRTSVVPGGNPQRPNWNALQTRLTTLLGDRGREVVAAAQQVQPFATNRLEFLLVSGLSEQEATMVWPYLTGIEGRVGLIDAWTASTTVLDAVVGAELATTIINARPASAPASGLWLAKALGAERARLYGTALTSGSYQFRADLLAVRNDGAGWARLDASIDCSTGSARVVRVRPSEAQGWPLTWATPEQVRQGQGSGDLTTYLTTIPH